MKEETPYWEIELLNQLSVLKEAPSINFWIEWHKEQLEKLIEDIPETNEITVAPDSLSATWSAYKVIESNSKLKQQLRDKWL